MLRPTSIPALPEETARIAKKVFANNNLYLTIGDKIGYLFTDEDFMDLYGTEGPPAGVSPAFLTLVTIFQFIENIPDRQAAEQVRARIDWKYALHLPLDDPGFDFSVLSDFRQRLVSHEAGPRVFKRVLERLVGLGLLSKGGKQRTDATYVLSAVRDLSRLELVAETMRLALEALAEQDPVWLRSIAPSHWYERYNRILTTFRLPRGKQKQAELAFEIGADGFYLLEIVQSGQTPAGIIQLPELELLHQVWEQQFEQAEGQIRWHTPQEMPPGAEQIATPHDPEARHTARKTQSWTGYQVHLSETCDPDTPHLITHVETTPATTAEITVLDDIHQGLAQVNLLPKDHLVDNGYIAGHAIVDSQAHYGVHLIGPVADDTSWQARQPDGLTADQFQLDWSQQRAICPEGHPSIYWSEATNQYSHPVVNIQFPKSRCLACPAQSRCTQALNTGRTLKLSLHFETILQRRQQQQTDEFKATYAARAGVEGTISAAVRTHGARRSRYIGQSKTTLQELFMATAINLKRAARWLMSDRPKGTRPPGLSCLAPA
jgi:transposase